MKKHWYWATLKEVDCWRLQLQKLKNLKKQRADEGYGNNTNGNPIFALDALQDAIYRVMGKTASMLSLSSWRW